MKRLALASTLVLVAAIVALHASSAAPDASAKVDALFSKWTRSTPGCAVGVAEGGKVVLEKAYGMADLEHDAPNAPDTIFEAGSVSKQFTAAAILLLAREGKLSLDDPARRYLPELPDYGKPITIRHLLTHTSGLRDWGAVEDIAGWPRTSRVYTHAHVLDIVSRQKSLNFDPGTSWSYCNTGYNLAAIIVARVSGQTFAEFCRQRLFEPLGMTRTSWRDDFRRVVKGRAIAYSETKDGFLQNMPFENVYGNGGLLTTVGDLLRWTENQVTGKVGGPTFLKDELEPGRLDDGTRHTYAMGLRIGTFDGLPEVSHSGSTAGYRAYLARYPEQHLSVAVLCNAASGMAERYAHDVASLYLRDALRARGGNPVARDDSALPDGVVARFAGLYRNVVTGVPLSLSVSGGRLQVDGTEADEGALRYKGIEQGATTFEPTDRSRTFFFEAGRAIRVVNGNGTTERCEAVERAAPTAADLATLAGAYVSDEAETVFRLIVVGGELRLWRRPGTWTVLQPSYKDAFNAPGIGLIRFRRDASGLVVALSVTVDRVWDLRFDRVKPAA